jgi:hypothetical protein
MLTWQTLLKQNTTRMKNRNDLSHISSIGGWPTPLLLVVKFKWSLHTFTYLYIPMIRGQMFIFTL